MHESDKPELWESLFAEKKEMWGFEPAHSAVLTRDFFVQQSVRRILIPGIGYGRNAKIFRESGITVTGIEISQTAIQLARQHFGTDILIHHGSVTEMPFDDCLYDGIFCHALIHLLDSTERAKLIHNCHRQLSTGGYMFFSAIAKTAPTYGQGNYISQDRYEVFEGIRMFFYDRASIHGEFGKAGLFEITEVEENYPFFLIKCQKDSKTED